MMRLYREKGVLFSVIWIILYCAILAPIKGSLGEDSIYMLLALAIIAAAILGFVKANHLEEECGLDGWPKDTRKHLYFIPMWILTTGNLWGGINFNYQGAGQIFAILSMLLVGFVEEMIFRGFLFRAMLRNGSIKTAVIISSVTFGMGHIVNLFAGQASAETMIQIVFAVAWGFILTMVFYKSEKLLPCIIAHGLIDAFSTIAADNPLTDKIYVCVTIIVSVLYCIYLSRLTESNSRLLAS